MWPVKTDHGVVHNLSALSLTSYEADANIHTKLYLIQIKQQKMTEEQYEEACSISICQERAKG